MKETLTTIEKALFLKELEFFSQVGIEQAAEIAALAEEVHFEPGHVIFRASDPSAHVFLVIEGNIIAEKDGIVTTVIGAGKGFGDLTLTPEGLYGFDARTVEHTHVLRFSIDDLVETMHEHPEMAVGMVRALALRLREASQQLADLGRQLQDSPPCGEDPSS